MKFALGSMFILLIMLTETSWAVEKPQSATNPHSLPLTEQGPACQGCHAPGVQKVSRSKSVAAQWIAGDGIEVCVVCHQTSPVKHMIGERPDFEVPQGLPLDAQGRINCMTCHYTHGPLHSEKPWVDVSWFDRLTNSERLHKTFLLRQNNRGGRLCMACHDA